MAKGSAERILIVIFLALICTAIMRTCFTQQPQSPAPPAAARD